MDLTNTSTRIPDTESETPPHSQSIKPFLSFPNGKNHHYHQQPPPKVVVYKECLKNHAASIGGHALDGCGEFMPSPAYAPTEPTSLKCAACGCHRNFHRRDPSNEFSSNTQLIEFHPPAGRRSSSPPPPPPPLHPANYASYAPHVLLSLSTAAAADQNHTVVTPGTPMAIKVENPSGRKRFRTKFSQDQKDKMSVFAEKVGWKMQRCDEKMVADFCNEIGIKRGIFKVWMHNNKNTFKKREKDAIFPTAAAAATITPISTATATAGISKIRSKFSNISDSRVISSEYSHEDNVDEQDNNSNSSSHQENGSGGGHSHGGGGRLQASTNASSSSS